MSCRTVLTASTAYIIAFACASGGLAASLTYRLDDEGERLFRYAGGLQGGTFDARLEGTFEIQRDDDGLATITQFDVLIVDPLLLGPPSILGNPAGKPLSDYLVHDPVGLQVTLFPPPPPPGVEPDTSTYPRTIFSVANLDAQTTQLRLYSGFNALDDAPASFILEGGIKVDVVPEPATFEMIAIAIGALSACRRRA